MRPLLVIAQEPSIELLLEFHYRLADCPSRRYSSSDCFIGIFLFAQGEFARWFKRSSSQSSVKSSTFKLASALGGILSPGDLPLGDLSFSDSIVYSFLLVDRHHHLECGNSLPL